MAKKKAANTLDDLGMSDLTEDLGMSDNKSETSIPAASNGSAPTVNTEQQQWENQMRLIEGEIINNVLTSRSSLARAMQDPRRSIDDDCGYPLTSAITSQDYRDLYDRFGVATRVVQIMPHESWKVTPGLVEDDDPDNETPFEAAWEELGKKLKGKSWFQGQEGNSIWEHLLRADILSGIGSFGVTLLGLGDGKPLSDPAEPSKGQELLFLRSFDESLVSISSYESDENNSRFGEPTKYRLTFVDPRDSTQTSTGQKISTLDVHWSRIHHLADNLGSSEIIGVSRLRPNYNRLLDLRKLYGGSAEMYWRGAFPGISFETHPQLGPDTPNVVSSAANKQQIEQFMNTLQRYISLSGLSAKSLAPQVVDPTPQINAQLNAICIEEGVPMRIFMGSERGELASSQDSRAWNGRLQFRQTMHVTPRVIAPFVDRLIHLGVLPEPVSYSVAWPDLNALSDQEKADVALKQTESLVKYVQGGVEAMMTPMNFLISVLGFSKTEAEVLIEAAIAAEPILGLEDDEEEFENGQNSGREDEDKT